MRRVLLEVAEGRRLILPREVDTPRYRERLLRAGETAAGSAFRLHRSALYARDLVGIVSAGAIQIQITPKIYDSSPPQTDRAALLQLLIRSVLPIKGALNEGNPGSGEGVLLETLIRHYAEHFHRLMLLGAPRRYSPTQELSPTLRGRIDFTRAARRRPGTEHLIPLRLAPLTTDHALTRLLKALVLRLASSTASIHNRELLSRLEGMLHSARTVPLTARLVDQVLLSRLEADWAGAVDLATVLVRNKAPDVVRPGLVTGFTLLFPIYRLFEMLLKRSLRESLREKDMVLTNSIATTHLLRTAAGAETLHLRPDLIICRTMGAPAPILVADAKWKRLDLTKDGLGLDRHDIYQVLAYMQRLDLTRGLLIYPSQGPLGAEVSVRIHPMVVVSTGKTITAMEVDVAKLLTPNHEVRLSTQSQMTNAIAEIIVADQR